VRARARVTGDEVRAVTFPYRFIGYSPLEVEAWLKRVADSIDSGASAECDYPPEMFGKVLHGYGPRVVDRFAAALSVGGMTAAMLAAQSRTPARVKERKAQPTELLEADGAALRYGMIGGRLFKQRYRAECDAEWDRFADLPGTRLYVTTAHVVDSDDTVLMTTSRGRLTEITSGRVFRAVAPTSPWSPRFRGVYQIVDDRTGELIISRSGLHSRGRASGTVSRDQQPWLWFPVHGTGCQNAVMRAIDASGTAILSFRWLGSKEVEIVVPPDQTVTTEILCIIAIAGLWLRLFFTGNGH
jgi:DivIVA domain-containing protein